MPRKKTVKSAVRKKQPSRQVNKTPANSIQKLETEFTAAPAKIAEQLTKEITAYKQQENKLATTLVKIQAQASRIEKSIAAAKKPATAAAKKQVLAAKKALNDTKKDYALSNAALKNTAKLRADAELRLARVTALAKHLKEFDKIWAKQAKKLKDAATAKAKAANKPKAKRKSRTSATRVEASQPALTVIEQPDFESFDNSVEETEFDDAKQAKS